MAETDTGPVSARGTGGGLGLYVRLSAMMFLQFAVWGAWAVMIARHMAKLGLSEKGFRERAREIDGLGDLAEALADDVPETLP